MSDGAQLPYSVDASSLMEWQSRPYPVDVFPSLAGKIADLIKAGRFSAPALVYEEVKVVGTAELITWAGAIDPKSIHGSPGSQSRV